jgi:DNA-binding LacI/PurR family transcriptional regulator
MATVKDVARKAGVSTATVSRVLNRSATVDAETAAAVNRAINQLGYRRNINWRRLSRQSSDTICFLSGGQDSVNSTLVRSLAECERIFNEAGYDLMFQTCRSSPDIPAAELHLPHLISHQGGVDGVILVDLHHGNLLEALTQFQVPFVGLGNNILGTTEQLARNMVFYDDISASRSIVRHLLNLGHCEIAFVGKPEPWFRRRYEGYRQAMDQAGLPEITIRDAWQIGNIEYGRRAAARLFLRDRRPTAIFGANDEIAAGIWNELMNRGIRVPADISLAGFGDREEFSVLEPPLTTVAVSPERIGSQMARMLLDKLQRPGFQPESKILECDLMLRGSSARMGEASLPFAMSK